jgi:sugar O-acyltransferase (sialic acid O-acetyltransferase NeuD family)
MKQFVIFGICGFLSDIFDLIHDKGGKVSKIYLNMLEVRGERGLGLKERASLLGYDVKIHDSLASFRPENGCHYIIGTTTPRKHTLIAYLKKAHSLTFSPLIHSSAYLGSNVRIGEGVMVNVRATIAPNVFLDDHCVINRCVNIGHDSKIGQYSNIAPSVVIAGSTEVGRRCRIGIGATILDGLRIGDGSVIGAGSLVTKDVPDAVVAYGSPAKVVREIIEDDFKSPAAAQP